MFSAGLITEIVRIRPKEGSETRLLEIRDGLVQQIRDTVPAFSHATLIRPEDGGTWVDLWFWTDKAAAADALDHPERTPLFIEWTENVDLIEFEWAKVITDHSA